MKNKVKKQSGYTMVELTIGITVASLVLSATLMGVQKMMDNMAMNKSVQQIANAAANVKKIIMRDPNTEFVSKENMTKPNTNAFEGFSVTSAGLSTAVIRNANGNVVHPYGGSGMTFSFEVFMTGVSECYEHISQLESVAKTVSVHPRGGGNWITVKGPVLPFEANRARDACKVLDRIIFDFSM